MDHSSPGKRPSAPWPDLIKPGHGRESTEAKFVCLLLTRRGWAEASSAQNRRTEALKAELVSLMLCSHFQLG